MPRARRGRPPGTHQHHRHFFSIIGIFEAVAHRVAIWLAPQLADAARGELVSSRSAKFVHVLLPGAETTGRNRNFNLVRIFPHLKLYTLNRGGFACLILWRERRGIGRAMECLQLADASGRDALKAEYRRLAEHHATLAEANKRSRASEF